MPNGDDLPSNRHAGPPGGTLVDDGMTGIMGGTKLPTSAPPAQAAQTQPTHSFGELNPAQPASWLNPAGTGTLPQRALAAGLNAVAAPVSQGVSWGEEGPANLYQGLKHVIQGDTAKGVNQMAKGLGVTLLPAAAALGPGEFAANPVRTTLGVAGGVAGGYGAKKIALEMGAKPETAEAIGNLTAIGTSIGLPAVGSLAPDELVDLATNMTRPVEALGGLIKSRLQSAMEEMKPGGKMDLDEFVQGLDIPGFMAKHGLRGRFSAPYHILSTLSGQKEP